MILRQWTLDQLLRWIGAIGLTVVFVPMGVYLTHTASSSIEQNLSERTQGLAATLAVQTVDPLLSGDRLALHAALDKAVTTDTELRYLCIEDTERNIVAHTFADGCPTALIELWKNSHESTTQRFRTENEPLMDIAIPILAGQLGTLHIGMSRAPAVRAAGRLLWLMGIILAAGMSAILIGSQIVATKVSRPLCALEAQVSQFSKCPNIQVETKVSGVRELDSLSCRFSEMVHALQLLERERAATQQRMIHAERLAALGELAAGLAHEVHNPLDGMLECLRYLNGDPQKSKRAEKYYPMLEEGLERISRVMQQALTFARSGEQVTLQPCKIADILETLELLVQSDMRGRKVRLTSCDLYGGHCLCDKQGLEQVGLNLILNAAEAAEENPDPKVRVEVNGNSRWVYISVEDSGSGVPDQLRDRIFNPFFTTKAIGKGTGLGLAVSRQLIGAAGGELELSRQVSLLGGARFLIRVPKA